MGAAPRISTVPWTRPGTPRVSGRPSWIGMPAVRVPSEPPPPPPPSTKDEPPPPSSKGPPSVSLTLARASNPPVSPIIQSAREVELEHEVAALHGEIARLATELARVRDHVLEESERDVVRLAVTIAARVVGRELTTDPQLVTLWVREGLATVPDRTKVTVAVATDVGARIDADALGAAKVVVDATLPEGTCELREGASVLRVSADERFAAMNDALGTDEES